MKTKLSRIMGIGLALILVLSLTFALMPTKETQAIEGEQLWLAQPMPTNVYLKMLAGSDVTEFAIASDGLTMYLIDGSKNLSAAGAVYKSLDGGVTWAAMPAIAATAQPVTNVAVSPDNPDAVAVSSGSNAYIGIDEVWVSNNGGTTWSQLPAPNLSAAQMRILDLKVAPARVGTLFPHEYIIATSDNRPGNVTLGTLQMIGQTAAWINIQAGGTYDFTSCELSPGHAGDRIATAVGSAAANNTVFATYNTQTPALAHAAVQLNAVIDDYDGQFAATQSIIISDIALPIDYDVTVPGFERAFAGTACIVPANDNAYRCDSVLPAQGLGLAGTPIRSLAYSGTTTAGTLFEGNYADAGAGTVVTQVNWTTQMTTNLPVWYPSRKPPTGCDGAGALGGRAYVRTSPTFDSDSKVYAGTTDGQVAPAESALSLSTDAGDTYNQIAFIDNGVANNVVAEHALALTPDAGTLFMVTDDGTEISLWQTPSGPAPFTYNRIYCVTAAGPMLLSLNVGGWADAPEIYMTNTAVAANGLFASYDGGKIFTNKHLPLAGAAFLSVAGSKTLYLAIGANVYKSINGGQQWGPPISANVGAAVATVLPAPNGDILAGGVGLASISTDGGASFAQLQPGLPAQTIMVMADSGYTDNNTVYGFDNTGATGVYRVNIATGAIWENLAAPTAANIIGFGQSNGVLYAMSAASADRTLDMLNTVGTLTWGTMNVGAPAAVAGCFALADSSLYVGNGVVALWAYNDQMATAKTTVTQPAAGTMVPVDPVNGRGVNTVIAWNPIGTGQGLATGYDILIYDTSAGPAAGSLYSVFAVAAANRTAPMTDTASINGTVVPGAGVAGFVLRGGTEYGVWVRASTQLGTDNVVSPWSDAVIFQVEASGGVVQPPHAGPLLTSPNPGDQNVDPGAAFSWAPMSGVTEYELIIATDAALTQAVAGTPVILNTTAYGPVELEYDTDYYYAVRATSPTSSVQSIGAFHTMISPEEEAPPVTVTEEVVSPAWIWAVVIIGALLVIAVLVLIVRTRRA